MTTKKDTTALTTTAAQLPDYLRDVTGASGLQGLEMSDFIVPRVKLMQGLSEEPKMFDDAKVGEFWLNVLDQPLGPTFDFIPISNRKRYLLSTPMGSTPTGILARAEDGIHWTPPNGSWDIKLKGERQAITWKTAPTVRESGLAEFGSANPHDSNSNPAATLFYDYLVYLPDHPDISPVLLSLSRTASKKARDLNGKIEFSKKPMQALRFTASVAEESNNEGQKYGNYVFQRNGWATEDEFKGCTALGERYKEYRGADEEGEVAEAQGGGKPGDTDTKGEF